jgi:hypothetical protein
MKKIKYIFLVALAVSFTACDVNNELDEIPADVVVFDDPTPGTADFSNYVAIGASFTAGFSDGSVFLAAQQRSFPAIMSNMMANMGGGSFTQPLVNDNIGGLLLGGQQISNPRLFFNGAGPAVLPGTPTTEVSSVLSGPFNNMGVPGAKSFHLLAPGYGSVANVPLGLANPYYARMASAPTATVLGDAAAQGATFFTISEIGGNDVLGYATSGGTGTVQTGNPDPTTYGPNDITDPGLFTVVFNNTVQAMTANGAKGAVVTVPSIVNLPFFTTVPYNAVPLDEATANALNGGYAAYNGGLQLALQALAGTGLFTQEEVDRRTINFTAGQNAVVIIDEDLTDLGAINPAFAGIPQFRQATAEDFLVLTSSSFIGTTVGGNPAAVNGLSVPLADNWVLTPEEQNNIQVATDAYNAVITNIGTANNLAVVDLDGLLAEAATSGTQFDDFTMTTSLVFGGMVSLDGIHLTSRGYALMAKKILEGIDATYGSNFEASGNLPKANNYPTNYPPGI